MKTSLIIPQYERWELTLACCSSLLRHQDCELELIVIDDGSSRETLRKSQRFLSNDIQLISQEHAGITRAWNQGIDYSQGETIVLLNNDVETLMPWLNGVSLKLQQEPRQLIGAAGSTAKAKRSLKRVCSWLPESFDWLAGWCLGFTREHYREIGPFDEGMNLYWSDTDWQLRHFLHAAGAKNRLGIVARGCMKHIAHRTTRSLNEQARQQQLKTDRAYFACKWSTGPRGLEMMKGQSHETAADL